MTFLIDQNGILNVSALEKRSGQSASVQIIPSHGLTPEEVKTMQRDAVKHARADMTAHHLIDVRTTLLFDLNKSERMLNKYGHLVDGEYRQSLGDAIRDLRVEAQTCSDPEVLNARRESFNKSTLRLAERAVTASLQDEDDQAAWADEREASAPQAPSK